MENGYTSKIQLIWGENILANLPCNCPVAYSPQVVAYSEWGHYDEQNSSMTYFEMTM